MSTYVSCVYLCNWLLTWDMLTCQSQWLSWDFKPTAAQLLFESCATIVWKAYESIKYLVIQAFALNKPPNLDGRVKTQLWVPKQIFFIRSYGILKLSDWMLKAWYCFEIAQLAHQHWGNLSNLKGIWKLQNITLQHLNISVGLVVINISVFNE